MNPARFNDFDLRDLGWGVIPVGAVVGAVLAMVVGFKTEQLKDAQMAIAMVVGFAIAGAGAGGLLFAWNSIKSKWLAVPLVFIGMIVLLVGMIVCIGRLAEGR
jgi:hypothetical protein